MGLWVLLQRLVKSLFGVEPKVGLALSSIRTMALEAAVGQDGTNVKVKVDHVRDSLSGGGRGDRIFKKERRRYNQKKADSQ
jgi:hypothetical protein